MKRIDLLDFALSVLPAPLVASIRHALESGALAYDADAQQDINHFVLGNSIVFMGTCPNHTTIDLHNATYFLYDAKLVQYHAAPAAEHDLSKVSIEVPSYPCTADSPYVVHIESSSLNPTNWLLVFQRQDSATKVS